MNEGFAISLFLPAFLVLLRHHDDLPLIYLAWNSVHRVNLTEPWVTGFAGGANYTKMLDDPRFWNSLELTAIYTGTTIVLQMLIGLGLALLVMQIPRGQGVLRVAAIVPIVLAPVVVGLFWRTLVLAPDFGVLDFAVKALGLGSHDWLGDPGLALASVIVIHTWQWTPFAFLVILASLSSLPPDIFEAARIDRASSWQRFWHITALPLIRPCTRDRRHHADDGGAVGIRRDLRRHRRRPGHRDRNPQPLYLPHLLHRTELRIRLGARHRALGGDAGGVLFDVPPEDRAMKRSGIANAVLIGVAGVFLTLWTFPVLWALLTSFKTERDVLAYPPTLIFTPTLGNYRDVLFGATTILPNLMSSLIVAMLATVITMLLAIPAAYALARLNLPARRAGGFYILATQMLPPVGLIIPYFLFLQKIGWLDSYKGMTLIYLTFSLPFAIWLMVSYFEDVPREMEEAALIDRAGRLRAFLYIVLPQIRGGIEVTVIFV